MKTSPTPVLSSNFWNPSSGFQWPNWPPCVTLLIWMNSQEREFWCKADILLHQQANKWCSNLYVRIEECGSVAKGSSGNTSAKQKFLKCPISFYSLLYPRSDSFSLLSLSWTSDLIMIMHCKHTLSELHFSGTMCNIFNFLETFSHVLEISWRLCVSSKLWLTSAAFLIAKAVPLFPWQVPLHPPSVQALHMFHWKLRRCCWTTCCFWSPLPL